ncbi:trans-1,2-dihydrobenzene-1,2-diol dehydrogenase-like [Lineus longissimus]|uniref:trans-1,2-dihydrobenzene-1,2-diol dehydrogenase-like n=1 Tax=Lineus longissimus TaxID=88925 RepID=UPI002B4CDF41
MPVRWGIVSAGKICHDFVQSFMDAADKQDNEVVAVAARDQSRAQQFADEFKLKKAYGSYEEMARDPEIDVAYLGNLHQFHLSVGKLFLDHGKHLLVEKPLTMTHDESKQLLDYAKSKNRFVMEAVWSRFFPAMDFLRETLTSGAIGEPKLVTVHFGFNFDREDVKDFAQSAQHFLAVYVLHFPLMVYEGEPEQVHTTTSKNKHGVVNSVAYTLKYKEGMAQLYLSVEVATDSQMLIYGTKGKIEIPENHWTPETVIVNGVKHEFPIPGYKNKDDRYNYPRCFGLFHEVPPVADCVRKGLLEHPLMSHRDTLLMAKINDQL